MKTVQFRVQARGCIDQQRCVSGAALGRSQRGKRPSAVVARAAVAADSMFDSVEQAPADPILGVTQAFRADNDESKLNLGVGAYRDDNLQPVVLNVVRKAEERVLSQGNNKEYLPIEGFAPFNKVSAELMFGADSSLLSDGKIVTLQSLSGTGSLRVGAAFINRFFPGTSVYIPNPSWGNHKNIFADAGVAVEQYSYFDKETIGLNFTGMIADLKAAPEGSVVILHACAHNPTGIDPTREQWTEILELCKSKKFLPFFDSAYQGFASGDLITDAFAVRMFADAGLEMLVSQSYAKNLGLYGERVGALHCVAKDADNAKRALSQLKRLARALYSNPPTAGARIVAEVVGDDELFAEWKSEMAGMAGRIKDVRGQLVDCLKTMDSSRSWDFITEQIGMFSYTGMTPAQVENMTNKHHVYMTKDGRISLAGLSSGKVEYLANAIVDSFNNA
ncbi:aspartate aminotransferase [Chloropicon primus]|nr:aspartate aminotransferase [Chloropicon primus]